MIPGSADGRNEDDRFIRDLSRQYRDVICRYFYRVTGSSAEADDLTQELFVRLIRKPDIRNIFDAQPYLFRIAINLLRDRSRRKKTSSAFLNEMFVSSDGIECLSPERVLQGKQSLSSVLLALERVDPRSRNMFILQRIEGMKYSEIAALYGISVSAVEKHIIKCVATLGRHTAAGWK